MLMPVEWNNFMTQSKHKVISRKANKERGNDPALPVSQMLWNYPEDTRKFYSPVVDIKGGILTGGEESSFQPAE